MLGEESVVGVGAVGEEGHEASPEEVEVIGGEQTAKKQRIVAHARQTEAVSCPVFIADREDLVNFDVFLSRIWRETEAWRYGIAKVVLKPEVYREFFGEDSVSWDESECGSFWKTISSLPVTRKIRQCVEKLDNGLFRVNNTCEVVPKDQEPESVGDFLTAMAKAGLIHPFGEAATVSAGSEIVDRELPSVIYTSDKEPTSNLCLPERRSFWATLPVEVGGVSDPISYVTELNSEPVAEDEAEQRLKSSSGEMLRKVSFQWFL